MTTPSDDGLNRLKAGDIAGAAEHFSARLATNSRDAEALHILGVIALQTGATENALHLISAAAEIDPDRTDVWTNLGEARLLSGDGEGAVAAHREARRRAPTDRRTAYNLANALRDIGRLSEAKTELQAVLANHPDYAKAWNALGTLLGDMARPLESFKAFGHACSAAPDWAAAASNKLCAAQYLPNQTPAALDALHRQWAKGFGETVAVAAPFTGALDPDRKLRVGFVSPDFGMHPVGLLSVGLFETLDHGQLEPVVFSTRDTRDEDLISHRISAACDWRRVARLEDEALSAEIRRAKIDILFDMSGHTSRHRLGVFRRKPAPIQISWIGYVGTTGLDAIDYVLADRIHAPPDEPVHGPEQILRLDGGYVCFDRAGLPQPANHSPFEENGYVTFGCLNNAAKLNDDVLTSFARVLSRLPSGRLLLRFRWLDDPEVEVRIRTLFNAKGIAPERVTIEGAAPRTDFLATYNRIDLALDTFLYSGGLTTCEALAMGVPVITRPGATFAGRHAASHLTSAGLGELIASDTAAFEDLGVSLATDPARLSGIRSGLAKRVASSPLCDAAAFARNFERTLRAAWKQYVASAT